jgi:hypothetical protein
MNTPPTGWHSRLLNVAVTLFAAALLLYVAARLVLAVLPVLIVVVVIALLGVVVWHSYWLRRSRW